ncbi:DUF1634 domain containing protein [Flavobacterium daejeonense]|nr:DUF1634 domain containing protein [Flavobacterium daejeonense]
MELMEKSKIMSQEKFKEKVFQMIIGNLLRYGVWISLSIAFMGGITYLINHGNEPEDYSVFIEKDNNIFNVVGNVCEGLIHGSGESIIFSGILLLFLTPMLRLLISLFVFFLEKDYLYVFITSIVAIIIGLSVSFGFSH